MKPENLELVRRRSILVARAIESSVADRGGLRLYPEFLEQLLDDARADALDREPIPPVVLSPSLDGPVVPLRKGDRLIGYVLEAEARNIAMDDGSPRSGYSIGYTVGDPEP